MSRRSRGASKRAANALRYSSSLIHPSLHLQRPKKAHHHYFLEVKESALFFSVSLASATSASAAQVEALAFKDS